MGAQMWITFAVPFATVIVALSIAAVVFLVNYVHRRRGHLQQQTT